MSEKSPQSGREQFSITPEKKVKGEKSIVRIQHVGRLSEFTGAATRLSRQLLDRGVERVADRFGLGINESVFPDRGGKTR